MKYQTQQLNICSKLTIEALEQGVKLFKIKNKDNRAMTSFCSRVDGDSKQWFLANLFLFKVNNRGSSSTITCEICKVDNKDIRPRSMTFFWCLYC